MKFINALVVKLVDTKDLKSFPFMERRFESGREYHALCKIIIFDTVLIKSEHY